MTACTVSTVKLEHQDTYVDEDAAHINNAKIIDGETILFIADNQEALITTEPILELSRWSEINFNTAHRRTALDAFSLDIVDYIVEKEEHDLIVIGGDILNNSCKWEFDRVAAALNTSDSPWFVAPGNHDGFYQGISSPTAISKGTLQFGNVPLDERQGWAKTCVDLTTTEAGFEKGAFDNYKTFEKDVVDKVAYIGEYLRELGILSLIESQPEIVTRVVQPGEVEGYEDYAVLCIDFKAATGGLYRQYMSDICWTQEKDNDDYFNNFYPESADEAEHWDEKYPWRNFVVQKLEFESASILLVDSSSYSEGIAIADSGSIILAGKEGASGFGHISEMQWRAIQSFLDGDKELVIISHHPLWDYDPASYAKIENLFEQHNAVRVISADTHNGYDASFRNKGSGDFVVKESNIGSTIDAPIEYGLAGFTGGEFVLKRYSMTPMRVLQGDGTDGEFKQSLKPVTDKHYATMNPALWDGACADAFGPYVPNSSRGDIGKADIARGDDPFLTGEFVSPLSGLELEQVSNPFSFVGYADVYSKNLYIYKISRLIWLSEIYNKLYAYAGYPMPDQIVQLENEIEAELKSAKENYTEWLSDTDTRPFYSIMVNLSHLTRLYMENMPMDDNAQLFKVCSAIYETESEADY
jgi:hypothetical protein